MSAANTMKCVMFYLLLIQSSAYVVVRYVIIYLTVHGLFKVTPVLEVTFRARRDVAINVLCYERGGRGFDSRCCHCNFSVTYSYRSHYGPGG